MQRSFAFLGAGIIVGAVLMLTLYGRSPDLEQLADVRDLTADIQIDTAEIEQHREDSYRSLDTVEDILKLPTDFARREAAHVLAGRSDSAKVQELIAGASRIADSGTRTAMLEVFFTRLTGLDPRSALAVSRFEQFRNDPDIERVVWVQWARRDLDSALFEAGVQTTLAKRFRAAQALFAAHGHDNNPTVEKIRDASGFSPDSTNRSLFVQDLVNRSPEEAIAYINAMAEDTERGEAVSQVANYLSLTHPETAEEYTSLLRGRDLQDIFRHRLANRYAEIDPAGMLEELLAGPWTEQWSPGFHTAIREVAKQDVDLAMSYLERLPNRQARRTLANVVVHALLAEDIDRALEWARSNPTLSNGDLELSVLTMLAPRDPRRAFDEAMQFSSGSMRPTVLQSVLGTIAQNNAQLALELIREMPESHERNQVAASAVSQAMASDPDTVVEWLASLSADQANAILVGTNRHYSSMTSDIAMRLLPLVSEANRPQWLRRTAVQIVQTRSPDEAFSFISQFEGTPDYEAMRGVVISTVSQTDPERGLELIASLPDGQGKDRAMVTIIAATAMASPERAIGLLDRISDEQARSRAVSGLTRQWASRDPDAAMRWADQMPIGGDRDDAIVAMSNFIPQTSSRVDDLIDDINDPRKRSRAKMQRVTLRGRGDPVVLESLLDDPDILPEHKERVRRTLQRIKSGSFRP